jgi:hypothetical protein
VVDLRGSKSVPRKSTAFSLQTTGIVEGKAPVNIATGTNESLGATYKSGMHIQEVTGTANIRQHSLVVQHG